MRDINVLLDALLTPPRAGGPESSRHFYESARAIIAGYIAWVRFREPREFQTLGMVYRMLSMGPEAREEFAELVRRTERFAGGLAHIAVERQAQVGKEEGGSNFSTVANQLSFLNYPELLATTSETSFSLTTLAHGDTDLFVVVPEDTVEHVKGWLRLWVAIPNAIASITPLERDMLIVIDEMPRLGYLKPVMDGYTMAAGKGVHFWCFAQSISALDSTWGRSTARPCWTSRRSSRSWASRAPTRRGRRRCRRPSAPPPSRGGPRAGRAPSPTAAALRATPSGRQENPSAWCASVW